MKARDHTERMLAWWAMARLEVVDLAVRTSQGMTWHRAIEIGHRHLGWARALNARGGDVYIRPAREQVWGVVFLDDLPPRLALAIAAKYAALVVQTSVQGGCHVWLQSAAPLDEQRRRACQRKLAELCEADMASTSGEHLGRLAGYRNWKRGGCWVNVLAATVHRPWQPEEVHHFAAQPRPANPTRRGQTGRDTSQSAREWGWVCTLLESGVTPEIVYARLVESARTRRGNDAERYARHTVTRAVRHVQDQE